MSTPFVATSEWRDVPDGEVMPGGLHYRVDLATGRRQARLIDPVTDTAAVDAFLAAWCGEDLPHVTLVAIVPDGRTTGKVFSWPEQRTALLAWVEQMNVDRNVYFSVNLADPKVNKKPTKSDLHALISAHADLDPGADLPLEDERARLLALADELAAEPRPPSFIVDSGGGIQVFYRAAEPAAAEPRAVAALEEANQRLEASLGGKGTHNADRIMRLPGTINHPNKKKRERGRGQSQARLLRASGRTYSWTEIEAIVAALEDEPPQHAAPAPAAKSEKKAANGADDIPFDGLPEPATAEQVEILVDCSGDPEMSAIWDKTGTPPPDNTQSGWDYHLCAHVARAGFSREMAARYLRAYLERHDPAGDHVRRPDYYQRTINAAFQSNGRATAAAAAPEPWPEPGVIGEPPPAPAFPTELLPGAMRRWIEIQANNMAVPAELLAVPALVTLGGVIGRDAVIMPKRHDRSWIERPCLWGAVVMETGYGKSPALTEATAPINRTEARLREAWKPLHAEWKARQAERSKAQRDTGIRGGDDPEPKEPKLVLNDTSIEAAADAMVNSRGLVLIRDELSAWIDNMSRYSRGSDRGFWLECHSGGVYRVDRIQRGRQVLSDLFCGIVGGIQPEVARRALGAALDGVDDGFLGRFGLICHPNLLAWPGIVDVAPERDYRHIVAEAFDRLAATPFSRDRPLRFDADAQQAWDGWYNAHMHDRVRGPAAAKLPERRFHTKGAGLVLRLCVAIHWYRWTTADGVFEHNRHCCDLRTLDAATGLYERFCTPSYQRIVAAFGKIAAHEGARQVADLILRKKPATITIGDVSKQEWAGLRERKDIVAALEALEDRDWLRPAGGGTGPRGGRPTLRWEVSPRVFPKAENAG